MLINDAVINDAVSARLGYFRQKPWSECRLYTGSTGSDLWSVGVSKRFQWDCMKGLRGTQHFEQPATAVLTQAGMEYPPAGCRTLGLHSLLDVVAGRSFES